MSEEPVDEEPLSNYKRYRAKNKSSYAARRLAEIRQEGNILTVNEQNRTQIQKKVDLINAKSEYVTSTKPIAVNKQGEPSIIAEWGAFLGTDEGKELLRQGIRATMINFAFGDKAAAKLVFGTAPNITQVDGNLLIGHFVDAGVSVQATLSPAEMRKLELENSVVN
jgi:hypothetical protein